MSRPRRLLLICLAAAAAAALASAAGASAKTVWLCKPGLGHDPCTPSLTTTRFSPTGKRLGVVHVRRVRHPRIDCFYVYPTVSDQKRTEATLRIDPVERSIALYQAARYSRDCRVYAPMYRQLTLQGIGGQVRVTPAMVQRAYADVRDAWRTYLRKFNHGRGVVLIGHSQGAFVLRTLVAREIDAKAAVRKRLVSAILLGGNVLVKKGRGVGGDFKHVRACRSARQLGCVVAFSTFDRPVTSDSPFGRTTTKGMQVLCTNPAALGGGSGLLDSIYPSQPFAPGTIATAVKGVGVPQPKVSTAWIESPSDYRAHCSSAGGAHVLQVTPVDGAPLLTPVPATWGLHLTDANIALGNLTDLVRSEAAAYVRRHP
jgi:Protein of unknown function (DUF3089)